MYSRFQLAIKYLHYYLTASNGKGHGIHSPFVFEFVKEVLNNKKEYYDFGKIEAIRTDLLHNPQVIEVEDLGAGSTQIKTSERKISAIAKHSLKSARYASLLFRIVDFYRFSSILELGTSLGITTSYLATANRQAKLITLEGSETVAKIAEQNFELLELSNISLLKGNFDDTLQTAISMFDDIDLAFIDGNHRFQPTVNYFNTITDHINSYSIIVLDDIHWSKEMEQAWEYCKNHSSVKLSVDLFFIGLLFFRNEFKEKQEFLIRF